MLLAAVDFGTMVHANLFTNIKVARIANCLIYNINHNK